MREFLIRLFAARPLDQILRDILDILIVAWVIYRALLVLKGTRAIQMAVGLGIVLLVYVGANWLNLATLRGVLSSLLSSFVLIVVVVFQNDIRRALIRMGNTSWFSGGREQQSRVIDEVVAAATELARHRMGALIAFEQDANVLEFAKSEGIHLDSVVTRELLVSLFVPESVNKLHDGAILIRDLRIARAGVFFPMPDTKVLDAQLGSRHRAALGITEETDAVVVVVSEERGTISFCFSGNIVSNLDGQSLRHALLGLFGRTARKKRLASAKKGGGARAGARPDEGSFAPAPAPQIRPPAKLSETPKPAPSTSTSRSSLTLLSSPSPVPVTPPAAGGDATMSPARPTPLTGKAITPAPGKLMASSTPMRASEPAARRDPRGPDPDMPPPSFVPRAAVDDGGSARPSGIRPQPPVDPSAKRPSDEGAPGPSEDEP